MFVIHNFREYFIKRNYSYYREVRENETFLIVGAGPAGIGMGILLKQLGIKNFRILFTLFIVGALHTRTGRH